MNRDFIRVGQADQDAVIKWQDHPRQEQVVQIERVLIEDAITFRALMAGDAALRLQFTFAVNVLHISEELGDIHAAIAIENAQHRLLDLGFAQDEFQLVAIRKLNGLQLLLRGKHGDLVDFGGSHGRLIGGEGSSGDKSG